MTLVAGFRSGEPRAAVVHGALAFSASHRGRRYANPTLVLQQDERVRIALVNSLAEPTIAHWHGLAVDTRNDGNGSVLVPPGERYEYDFKVRNRGGMYWYHPHPHGRTATQAYRGLYGVILVEDGDERALRTALDLSAGATDIPLVLQDRRDGPDYSPTPEDLVHGFLGDRLYVNGTDCPYHDVATRMYRFRILNAANARTLLLAFRTASGGSLPFTLIGNDGGLLPAPVPCNRAFLSTAERIDVLLDLRHAAVGDTIVLETLAFDPMHAEPASTSSAAPATHAEMGQATPGAPAPPALRHEAAWPEGAPRALLELRVRSRVTYDRRLPERLSAGLAIDTTGASQRAFRLGFAKGRWRINDRVFEMGVTPIEVVRHTVETWLVRNYHASMPHAMHLHGFQFEVLARETSPDPIAALAVDAQGRLATDLGRKDTVLVWPGESVRFAIDFSHPFQGAQTYMFHCHNLEHEDGGMMLGVAVT
ncbi:MAG TPA: multicopper oxidase domain-containing protein [Casimicrobiaceae bacterium]|nr:multicopper oxidase domain-containing protein [Casimicrobiaceae bacterium]